jgi:hypothetical protein
MDEPLDRHEYIDLILSQANYESPLETGQYLGFYIPGQQVLLNRIEPGRNGESAPLLSCPVSRLFKVD